MPGFNLRTIPANLGNVHDVHRAHRWVISRVAGITPFQLVYSKDLTLPVIGFEEESIPGASINYKFPKLATFSDVTMTFYDVHGFYKELEKLHDKIWTPGGGLRPANEYMEDTIFGTTNGKGKVLNEWTLKNSYVKELSHSELSYGDSELKTVTVVISYSWSEYKNTPVEDESRRVRRRTSR